MESCRFRVASAALRSCKYQTQESRMHLGQGLMLQGLCCPCSAQILQASDTRVKNASWQDLMLQVP